MEIQHFMVVAQRVPSHLRATNSWNFFNQTNLKVSVVATPIEIKHAGP